MEESIAHVLAEVTLHHAGVNEVFEEGDGNSQAEASSASRGFSFLNRLTPMMLNPTT